MIRFAFSFVMQLVLTTVALAQLAPSSRPLPPFATQLGAVHFAGGQASEEDGVRGVAAFPGGGAVVTGVTSGSLGEPNAGGYDAFVARFSATGKLMWITQIGALTAPTIPALNGDQGGPGGSAAGDDFAEAVGVAQDGSIFVAGSTSSDLGETNGGELDAFLAKLHPDGALAWLRQLGMQSAAYIVPPPGATRWGDTSDFQGIRALSIGSSGEIYVCGTTGGDLGENSGSSTLFDVLAAQFDPNGRLVWLRQMGAISAPLVGFDPSLSESAADFALRPSGELIIAGSTSFCGAGYCFSHILVLALESDGRPRAAREIQNASEHASGVVLDGSGSIYVAGSTHYSWSEENSGFETTDAIVVKLDAGLSLEWVSQMGEQTKHRLGLIDVSRSEFYSSVFLDSAGNVIAGGSTDGSLNELNAGSSDLFTVEMRAADGRIVRVSQVGRRMAAAAGLDASASESPRGKSVVRGPGDTIYFGGRTMSSFAETNAGEGDAFLARLTADGRPF